MVAKEFKSNKTYYGMLMEAEYVTFKKVLAGKMEWPEWKGFDACIRDHLTQGFWFTPVPCFALSKKLQTKIKIISSSGSDYDTHLNNDMKEYTHSITVGHLDPYHYVGLIPGRSKFVFCCFFCFCLEL